MIVGSYIICFFVGGFFGYTLAALMFIAGGKKENEEQDY